MAPDLLVALAADAVALAVDDTALTLEVVIPEAAAVVVAGAAAAVGAAAAAEAPAISLDTVALKVPVMAERVNLAEYAVKGKVGLVGSMYERLLNLTNHMAPFSPMDGFTVYVTCEVVLTSVEGEMFCRQVWVWTPPVQRSISQGPIVPSAGVLPSSFQATVQGTPAAHWVLDTG